jgi:hypothetical protein
MRILLIILALVSTASAQVKVTVPRAYTITLGGGSPAPSCPYDVTFTRLVNLEESPAGIWGPVTGNYGEGEATDSILADGYFQAEYNGTENRQTAICLGTGRNYDQPAYNSHIHHYDRFTTVYVLFARRQWITSLFKKS